MLFKKKWHLWHFSMAFMMLFRWLRSFFLYIILYTFPWYFFFIPKLFSIISRPTKTIPFVFLVLIRNNFSFIPCPPQISGIRDRQVPGSVVQATNGGHVFTNGEPATLHGSRYGIHTAAAAHCVWLWLDVCEGLFVLAHCSYYHRWVTNNRKKKL